MYVHAPISAVFKSQGKEKGGPKLVGKMFPPVKRLMESERKRILVSDFQ